jgi:NAD-dependent deacetylase
MIEKAAEICSKADLFILTGTSLAVYPAAGLIHYLRRTVKKYIIDPNIPNVDSLYNINKIEAKATIGVPALVDELISND